MRWTERVINKKEWHRWFAWRPVRLDEYEVRYDAYKCRHSTHYQWRWLTSIERRIEYGFMNSTFYREAQDVD